MSMLGMLHRQFGVTSSELIKYGAYVNECGDIETQGNFRQRFIDAIGKIAKERDIGLVVNKIKFLHKQTCEEGVQYCVFLGNRYIGLVGRSHILLINRGCNRYNLWKMIGTSMFGVLKYPENLSTTRYDAARNFIITNGIAQIERARRIVGVTAIGVNTQYRSCS